MSVFGRAGSSTRMSRAASVRASGICAGCCGTRHQGIFAFSDAPLKIAGPLGAGLVFLSVLTLLLPQTRHAIICLQLLLSGLQLLVLQAIGSYLARAYWEIKQRPVYIVRERSIDTEFSDKQREFSPPSRGGKYSGPSPVFQYSDGHRLHSCGADR